MVIILSHLDPLHEFDSGILRRRPLPMEARLRRIEP
jgi:hypothetical protein